MLVATQLARGSRRAEHDESRADIEPLDLALLLGEQAEAIERVECLDLSLLEADLDFLAPLVVGARAGGWE